MLLSLAIGGAIFLLSLIIGIVSETRRKRRMRWLEDITPPNTIFSDHILSQTRLRTITPFGDASKWQSAYLFLTNKRIVAYPTQPTPPRQPLFDFAPHHIEGFWRPEKYTGGNNTIWIHMHADGGWYIVQATLSKVHMQALVRALKELVSDDIVRAYRQRRPYIYRTPQTAHHATQNLHGAWELDTPFLLYLMPSALVFMALDHTVEQVVPLRDMQNIIAIPRIDTDTGGLVRFTLLSTGETLAIALEDYEAWAQAIAIASKRTLEEPLLRKQKGYDEDVDEDFEEVYDEVYDEAYETEDTWHPPTEAHDDDEDVPPISDLLSRR